jgi:hypothetical protein
VDKRTLQSHTWVDQREHLKRMPGMSQHVRNEDISQYVASLTLSDEFIESQAAQDRLWNGPHDPGSGPLIANDVAPQTQRVERDTSRNNGAQAQAGNNRTQRLLQQLAELEVKINELNHDVASLIPTLASLDSNEEQTHITKSLLSKIASFDDVLLRIDSRKEDVLEIRKRLELKLNNLHDSLVEAQYVARTNQQLAQPGTISYSSGEICALLSTLLMKFNFGMNDLADHHFEPILPSSDPILQVAYFLVVGCHIILHVGRQGCSFILSTLSYLLQLAVTVQRNDSVAISPRHQKMLSDLVTDIRTPTEKFHLEGKHTTYAVCPNPKCHQTYKPIFDNDSLLPRYPACCTNVFRNGRRCDGIVTRTKRQCNTAVQVPIKPFVYFDFKDWVASLLSRPGYEDMMDDVWGSTGRRGNSDIFDGTVLQHFKGPDGRLFSAAGKAEGHYVFSLNVDFFNPHGNSTGKSVSCGIISLVCLNLPANLRYKPDNMFLAGIIPGPHEPPLSCINNYLRPLINDLVDFWAPGVHFSRTFKHPSGKKVHCAIVALVSDLPAARKTAGFAGHSHNFFCAVCLCTLKGRGGGYENTNYEKWKRRTDAECRENAERWRNADSDKNAENAFNDNGMRWSELLRLPYFDIAHFVVVDAMHNLFLGLIKKHYEDIVGFSAKNAPDPQPAFSLDNLSDAWKTFSKNARQHVVRIRKDLEKPMANELETARDKWVDRFNKCNKQALHFFCKELNLLPADVGPKETARSQLTDILLDWVSQCPFRILKLHSLMFSPF